MEENGLTPSRSLAVRAKKRRSLSLHDANDYLLAARRAEIARAVIDAMVILIAAGFVERVAVGSVGERGAFVANGEFEDSEHVLMDRSPLRDREFVA